jgi:hypothetical protein
MTAREKAQAGLRMIEEAVLQTIRENGPMQVNAIRENLDLPSRPDGKPGICYQLISQMSRDGKLIKGESPRPKYSLPLGSTH